MAEPAVHLRPFREADLEHLARFSTDPSFSEPFLWFGFRSPEGFRRRWQDDGFLESDPRLLVVAQPDDTAIGWVSWRQGVLGAQAGVFEIGGSALSRVPGTRSGERRSANARRVPIRNEHGSPSLGLDRFGQPG